MMIIAVFVLIPFVVAGEKYNDTLRLNEDLFKNKAYNVHVRPVIDQNNSVTVNVSLSIESFIYLDEQEGKLSTIIRLGMSWYDELLTWQPDLYNGLQELVVSQNDIWKPDIILKNRLGEFEEFGNSVSYVVLNNAGHIVWEFFHTTNSYCEINFTTFPYDRQTCNITFKSLTLKADKLLFDTGNEIEHNQKEFGSWSVQSVTSYIETTNYSVYTVQIILDRNDSSYFISTIFPILLLVILNLITFCIPSRVGERISYSVTLFVAFQIFLSLFDTQFPSGVDFKLKSFLSNQLFLSGISVVESIFSMRIGSRKDKVSRFWIRFVNNHRFLICAPRFVEKPEKYNPDENYWTKKPIEDNNSQTEHSAQIDTSSNSSSDDKEKNMVLPLDEHINIDNIEPSEEKERRRFKVEETNRTIKKEIQFLCTKKFLTTKKVPIEWGDVSNCIDAFSFMVFLIEQLAIALYYIV